MNPGASAQLTFDWLRERWDYRLPLLLAVSLVVHVLSFYIFQTVYPATTSLPPPSARISVLNPSDPLQARLLDLVELNNPARISAPALPDSSVKKLVPPYRPTFTTTAPELLALDETKAEPANRLPTLLTGETLLPLRVHPEESERVFRSTLAFSENLSARAPRELPVVPSTPKLVQANTFFLGVNPAGEVAYSFLWKSSGDNTLDQTAESFLRSLRFKPASAPTWGMATLRWGVD